MTIFEIQKQVYQNKLKRNFNTTRLDKEIILMTEELGELARAYKLSNQEQCTAINNLDDIEDAIVDIMVYGFGMFAMLGIDGEEAIKKVLKNNEIRTHKGTLK